MSKAAFSGDEIISDILLDFAEAQEIMASHGIACAGCHVNQYETLREGVVAHYDQATFDRLLADLNEASADSGFTHLTGAKPPMLTKAAKQKIDEFQASDDKLGWGLKVDAMDNLGEPNYFLDFQKIPDRGDLTTESEGIKIFYSPESAKWLRNKQINYVVTDEDEGFKFEPR